MNKRYVIWSNIEFNPKREAEDLQEYYPDSSYEERLDRVFLYRRMRLIEIRRALQKDIGDIVVFGALREVGQQKPEFTKLETGVLGDCFYMPWGKATWYIDPFGDLHCNALLHGKTRHYLYRVCKKNTPGYKINKLEHLTVKGTITLDDINEITDSLGDRVATYLGLDLTKFMK